MPLVNIDAPDLGFTAITADDLEDFLTEDATTSYVFDGNDKLRYFNVYTGTDFSEAEASIALLEDYNLVPMVTWAYAPDGMDSSGGAIANADLEDAVELLTEFTLENNIRHIVIWDDMFGLRCNSDADSSYYDLTPGCAGSSWDMVRYLEFYQTAYDAIQEALPNAAVYGPNVHLKARSEGFDTAYNGVLIDSRDMDALEEFIDGLLAATPTISAAGVAFSGDFTAEEWEAVIEYVQSLVTEDIRLVVTRFEDSQNATPNLSAISEAIVEPLTDNDIVFWFADSDNEPFVYPYEQDNTVRWSFEAILRVSTGGIEDAALRTLTLSENLGSDIEVTISGQDDFEFTLPPVGQIEQLGDLEEGTYNIQISGIPTNAGAATLRFSVDGSKSQRWVTSDSIVIPRGN